MNSKEIGKKGEDAAASYLKNKNYKIIERNWKCNIGEADIIALFEDTIIFVEVKTRTNIEKGLPEDAVGVKKRRKYECIAAMYLQDHDYINMSVVIFSKEFHLESKSLLYARALTRA